MAGLCECVMEVHPENISLNQVKSCEYYIETCREEDARHRVSTL